MQDKFLKNKVLRLLKFCIIQYVKTLCTSILLKTDQIDSEQYTKKQALKFHYVMEYHRFTYTLHSRACSSKFKTWQQMFNV